MRLPLVLLSYIYTCLCIAQNNTVLTGLVTGEGETPLESAAVMILKLNKGINTDSTGRFVFTSLAPGRYTLRISHLGYENYTTDIVLREGETKNLTVQMTSLDSRLHEVVVTGTLREVRKTESVTNVDVYTSHHFERNPYSNLHESLNMVPGLFADIDNGVSNTSDVQINGLEGNYTMYLIDGVPAFSALAGYYALNAIPMEMIDKIEVLRGPASSLYGADAIAGVINIKTKNPQSSPRFTLNTMLTSLLEHNLDITARLRAGGASGIVSASGCFFNRKWDIDDDNFIDMPMLNRGNLFIKFSLPNKNMQATNVYARYLVENRYGGQMQFRYARRGSREVYGEVIQTHQWQTGIQTSLPLRSPTRLLLDYSGHYQHAYFGPNEYEGTQQTLFTQLTQYNQFDANNQLMYGVAYRLYHYTDNSPLTKSAPNSLPAVSHILGAFFEDEIRLHPQHLLLAGARIDYGNVSKVVLSPRINYKFNTKNEQNIVRAGVATGYRVPNLLNEGYGAINGSREIEITEALKPETTLSGQVTYTRIQKMKGAVLTLDANVFYTRFFNFIEPDYSEDPGLIVYANNTLGAVSTGCNIYTEMNFNFPLKLGAGISYNHVRENELADNGEKEREEVLHVPPFMLNYYLSYKFPAPQLSIDLTGNLVSPMLLSVVPNDYRDERSPWYTIQNIQLTKKFRGGWEWYMGLKNFFNFVQEEPILRPNDPFNRFTDVDNPYGYRFDTTYGFTSTQGIKAFMGIRCNF
ncbi:MAG: TonB-dependent receptor [Chitinophagales bacterium]|nr:TonB-dependent receptor [Chitinophagales bacterium]MDW8419547.1 TonB-dependent receptor [Chitinophagales bacterium]